MTQVFRPSSNSIVRITLIVIACLGIVVGTTVYAVWHSSYMTDVGIVKDQPVPFSHKHHVQGAGLDCRYCHATVEGSPTAGMPSTEVCMTCHSQLFTDAPALAPVRESYAKNEPIKWNRVHDMPDFVYFNHSAHVNKGVACISCHGNVDKMPLVAKAEPMNMAWCLDCHKNPEKFVGKKDEVFKMQNRKVMTEDERLKLIEAHHIDKSRMMNCYECHR